ncbi:hypothetical protein AB0G85_35310 [Streptomyces sioyaensis]
MTTHMAQQERTRPVPPAARDFARCHGDSGGLSAEALKQYVELGGA